MVTCGNALTVFKIYLKGLAHILITHSPTNDLWKMETLISLSIPGESW